MDQYETFVLGNATFKETGAKFLWIRFDVL